MGYMIVRFTSTTGAHPTVGWVRDNRPITQIMEAWLTQGQLMEILEYVPGIDPHADSSLIPQLNLWCDHLKEQADG